MSSDTLVTLIILGAVGGFIYWCTTQKWLGKWRISFESYQSYETYNETPMPTTATPYSTPTGRVAMRGPNDPSEIIVDLKLFGNAEITVTMNDVPVKTSYTYIVVNPDNAKPTISLTPKEKGSKVNVFYDRANDELIVSSYAIPAKRIASFYNNF